MEEIEKNSNKENEIEEVDKKERAAEEVEESTEEKLKTVQEKLLRTMADMENQRRRFYSSRVRGGLLLLHAF